MAFPRAEDFCLSYLHYHEAMTSCAIKLRPHRVYPSPPWQTLVADLDNGVQGPTLSTMKHGLDRIVAHRTKPIGWLLSEWIRLTIMKAKTAMETMRL